MEKTFSYKKITEAFIIFSILVLVFLYDYFSSVIGFYDEFLAFYFFIIILTVTFFHQKIKLYSKEIYIAISLLIIAIIGLLSNYHSLKLGYNTNKIAIIGDMINFFKAFLAYFGVRFLANNINSGRILNKLTKYSEIAFYILIVFLIIDFIFKIFPQYLRYGIHSYQLFFTHTSRYSFAFSFIFLMLFLKNYNEKKGFLLFILFLGLLSLRVKYFAFFLTATMIIFFGKKLVKIPRKLFLIVLGFCMLIIAFIFKDQLTMYFSLDTGWSRAIILVKSYKIGNDFFPFGTGFGTYSSFFSGKYYSWVYELYGIDHVYGISKTYWGFIADQFWPMVLGQFGYFGLLAFISVIYNFIMLFIIKIKNSTSLVQKQYMYVSLLGMLLLLIDSSSDAIFTQNRAVILFILFGLFINSYKENEEIYK